MRLAEEGCKVIATDVNVTLLKEIEGINGMEFHPESLKISNHSLLFPGIQVRKLDVTDTHEIELLVAEVDRVDILFNCAG